ncbi:T9SS type A sorting domain-containing protein [Myroides sp. JBRI-B21084]|uniref:T9SS type A sorting domain-containing protein n=1 Tax=Myroides sp. JBRI-B21084 TaxID=3119977 RepID=UPI0026E1196A|nr:T9SS type A sorting domain-containing protein [Paenimyroides cloacae]WKW46143.1 T9SS type A sorting domain-containing protein [Paenimyroides cloacae]
MKNPIKYTTLLLMLLSITSVKGQVLYAEDFESYNVGPFPSYTKGWKVSGSYNDIRIFNEPNRGKVLAWGWNIMPAGQYSFASCLQGGVLDKFEKRDPGNDILKIEFEFYSKDFTGDLAEVFESRIGLTPNGYFFRCEINPNESSIDTSVLYAGKIKKAYDHKWIKVEVYYEYIEITDSWEILICIPMLQYWDLQKEKELLSEDIIIGFSAYKPKVNYSGALVKYDNIKVSAVPTRPAFASVNDLISSKFNVYPTPATNVVNITNAENMQIQQVSVCDINGKRLNTQNYTNETEIKFNTEKLVSGTYMLHIYTNRGIAVKKMMKK